MVRWSMCQKTQIRLKWDVFLKNTMEGVREPTFRFGGLPLTCHMPMGKPLNLSGLQRDERFSGEALLSPPASRLMSKWEFSGPATYHTDILDLSTVPHPKP